MKGKIATLLSIPFFASAAHLDHTNLIARVVIPDEPLPSCVVSKISKTNLSLLSASESIDVSRSDALHLEVLTTSDKYITFDVDYGANNVEHISGRALTSGSEIYFKSEYYKLLPRGNSFDRIDRDGETIKYHSWIWGEIAYEKSELISSSYIFLNGTITINCKEL